MGSTADFIAATLADTLLPFFRRPVEDVILETLDHRQVPNRTDFKDLRDLVNNLRGQLSGATTGVKKLADRLEELEDRVDELDEQQRKTAKQVDQLEAALKAAGSLAQKPAQKPARKPTPKPARKRTAKPKAQKTRGTP